MYLEYQSLKELTSVLNRLAEELEDHGQLYVGEVCEIVGLEDELIDWSWGWKDIEGGSVQKLLGKWIYNFPRPIFLGDIDGPRAYVSDITKLIPKYAPKRKSKLREDVEIALWTLGAVSFALLWLVFMWWLATKM